ncbi:MAG: glycosyl hydrolase 53 family protein [Candidatus Bathyarchaeia archaeon]
MSKSRAFAVGVDANYALAMMERGLSWRDEHGERVEDLYRFLAEKGVNAARVRLWVGSEGPSRLKYATTTAKMAAQSGMSLHLVLFLSDAWADLFKQPAPKAWSELNLDERSRAVGKYTRSVARHFREEGLEVDSYQVGNEVDYGLCGVFASNKKRRKDLRWLKERVWRPEAALLRSAVEGLREEHRDASISLQLGKWWDPSLVRAFFEAMQEFGVGFDTSALSFFPSAFGSESKVFHETVEVLSSFDKPISIAEYAYPSRQPHGQFWYMKKPVPGYPLTPRGQRDWTKGFLAYCFKHLRIMGAFYWSPEMYLTRLQAKLVNEPKDMPFSFGWDAMALFNRNGRAKPALESFTSWRS